MKKIFIFFTSLFISTSTLFGEKQPESLPVPVIDVKDYHYLYAHGLGGSPKHKEHYKSFRVILPDYKCLAYSGPELEKNRFNGKKACLGQEGDIKKLEAGLKNDGISSDEKLIGVGISKGAATLINALGTGRFPMIKALVLEAPFAHAADVAYHLARFTQYLPGGKRLANLIMKKLMYPAFSSRGLHPITSAPRAPHIPILLIHSRQDHLIPVNHSRKLYKALVQAGNKNVYLVETEFGEHSYVFNTIYHKQASWLSKLIQTFYQQHGLPYDSTIIESEATKIDLEKFQPTLKEIDARINREEPGNFAYNISKTSKIAPLP